MGGSRLDVPAATLTRTLGIGMDIDITVVVKWQRAAAGDWVTPAADVSRRLSDQN
ncbi:hypothetical protein OG625_37150 [Streptomyces sp. NBC_01351]|uniref:hypothetical protein n=1 Tax=Streptomyces sp. NBC_01351 TaxID=2903833 RepID=UPI002E356210|nr:hypothetical protein [Streptomyces sp. NBC_01351]